MLKNTALLKTELALRLAAGWLLAIIQALKAPSLSPFTTGRSPVAQAGGVAKAPRHLWGLRWFTLLPVRGLMKPWALMLQPHLEPTAESGQQNHVSPLLPSTPLVEEALVL